MNGYGCRNKLFLLVPLTAMDRRELRNHDCDGVDKGDKKTNLYFTYESRDTLKSFSLFPFVGTISVETEYGTVLTSKQTLKILVIMVHFLQTTQSFVIFALLFCRGRQRNVSKIPWTTVGYSVVSIYRLDNAFSEITELKESPIEGQKLQQKDKKRRKRKEKKKN